MPKALVRISLAAFLGLVLAGASAKPVTPHKTPSAVHAVVPLPAPLPQPRCDGNAADRFVANPASYDEFRFLPGGGHAANALPLTGKDLYTPGDKALDLHIVFGIGKIYNPTTKQCDTVTLRFYSRTDKQDATGFVPLGQFVAPTIEVTPGDTIHVTLHNDLPNDDPSCGSAAEADMDHPHCFNGTNLHAHGLWVSPTGNSDNVLLSIYPGTKFDYIYNIPPDHPAGTFWYHTHLHGSTALQVSSGMAGAIVIHGNRQPVQTDHGIKNGDIDLLLKDAPDRVFVLQQIQYGCLRSPQSADPNYPQETAYAIQTEPLDPPVTGHNRDGSNIYAPITAWTCDADQTGLAGPFLAVKLGPDGKPILDPNGQKQYETGYEDSRGNGYGPGSWGSSNRYTSVNGVVLPTFTAQAGQVNRWRFVHGGVRDSINLRFYRMKPALLAGIPAQGDAAFVDRQCYGEPITYYLAAQDGLTMAQALPTTEKVLQPGYRADALVVFPSDGDYCVVDAASQAASNVWGVSGKVRLIGKVTVRGGKAIADNQIEATIEQTMEAGAKKYIAPGAIQNEVIADLKNDLKFTLFIPHPTVTDEEVAGNSVEQLYFEIGLNDPNKPVGPDNPANTQFLVGDAANNMHEYKMDRVDRTLILGTAQEWNLESFFVSHPFHIHVNPFQIVAILDPNGNDVSGPDAKDTFRYNKDTGKFDMDGAPDPEYRGLKGVWKDTIWVKNVAPSPALGTQGMYKVVIRTRYERYIGEFVLHCHILDHEDQGMMQNVQIVPPGYSGPGSAPMAGMGH